MKSISKFLIAALILITPLFTLVQPAHAQVGVCDFIGPLCEALNIEDAENPGEAAADFATSRINLVLSLIFVGIIILAVFIIIQAGVKYIQSQGEEDKIQESTKAIKSVFIGIAILFVGIVGVVLVLAFFGGTGLLTQSGGGNIEIDDSGNFQVLED